MKNKRIFQLFSVLFMFLIILTNCKKDTNNQINENGYLSIDLGVNIYTSDINSRLKSIVDVGDYLVIIYTEGGDEVITYEHASDMPDEIPLEPGTYYAIAHSNNQEPAAFDNPYYHGTSDIFTIVESETTSITINCELGNCKVTVTYSANVISDFDDYSTEVSNAEASLTFDSDETRAGYFSLIPITISATLSYTKNDGTTSIKTLTGSIPSPATKKHYEIYIDASSDEGSTAIDINIDESTTTEQITLSETGGVSDDYGKLIITEIMCNPDVISDSEGEWFEVYNNSTEDINLQNLVIRRTSTTTTQHHTISESIELSPGDYYVLACNEAATSADAYIYSSITLTNSDTEIAILTYGTDGTDGDEIASVYYDSSFPNEAGASLSLDPDHYDVDEAKTGSNWCEGNVAYDANSNLGTPGQVNSDCDI